MDLLALPPVAAVIDTAYRALIALTTLLEPFAGTAAAAAAVVVVTLLVRTALVPVGVSQAKAERSRARLAPRLADLQRRHRNAPERLQRETMQLYADEGTTPFAGCLPMLVQAPVVGVIYAVFVHAQIAGHGNALLDHTLAGVPLGATLRGSLGEGGAMLVFGVLVALIALVGELTRRAQRPGGRLAAPVAAPPAGSRTGSADAVPNPLAGPGAQRMLGALQFMTAVVACVVPLAAGIYLLVTVWWTLGQRVLLRRRYPIVAS
jgi:YidC/Oxa1 family membrane protein insertase